MIGYPSDTIHSSLFTILYSLFTIHWVLNETELWAEHFLFYTPGLAHLVCSMLHLFPLFVLEFFMEFWSDEILIKIW